MMLLFLSIISCSYLDDSDLKCYSLERRIHYLNNEIEYLNDQSHYLQKENSSDRLSDKKYSIAKISINKRLHMIDKEIESMDGKSKIYRCKE